MRLNSLSVLLLSAVVVLLWHNPVSASRRMECQETQAPTQTAAKLKPGQFVRVRTTSGREVKGHFRSFDGSCLVLDDKRNYDVITVASGEIVWIRSGRGFLGSLRHAVSESGRILAKPVTVWTDAYKKIDAIGDLMG